jgi:hypothetical protein
MTSSTSSNRIVVAIATLLLLAGVANAGRKRVVVLDFEGPKAEKFHDDIVKLLKKSHTVISADKWNGTADELDAGKVTEKNVKKVAKKLKIDGVITGKIEKRRDEYIIRLTLRAGTTGEVVGNKIDTKADGPRLDSPATGELKDELIGQVDDLEANHGGGGDDEDDSADKPSKKKHHGDDEADDDSSDKPSKKKHHGDDDDSGDDEDSGSKHSAFSKNRDDMRGSDKVDDDSDKPSKKKKHGDEDADADSKKKKHGDDDDDVASSKHDDDESPLPKSEKRKKDSDDDSDSGDDDHPRKRVARKDDDSDDDSGSVSSSSDDDSSDKADGLTPARRAIDVSAGISFTGRSLGFVYKSTLAQPPPGYKQAIPVAGAVFDATFFPLAFNKSNHEITSGIGLEVSYDKAIKINSQKLYNDTAGAQKVANLTTAESKLEVAGVFRYPFNKAANSPVVGGKLAYEKKLFSIQQALPGDADPSQSVDVPNVTYTIISPQGFIIYPVNPKIVLHALVGFDAVTNTGDIQKSSQYGAASVLAFEANAGLDYSLTPNIFLRGLAGIQTMGYTFKGDPMSKANNRDNDGTTQEVMGARDTYFGGSVTIGYAY